MVLREYSKSFLEYVNCGQCPVVTTRLGMFMSVKHMAMCHFGQAVLEITLSYFACLLCISPSFFWKVHQGYYNISTLNEKKKGNDLSCSLTSISPYLSYSKRAPLSVCPPLSLDWLCASVPASAYSTMLSITVLDSDVHTVLPAPRSSGQFPIHLFICHVNTVSIC